MNDSQKTNVSLKIKLMNGVKVPFFDVSVYVVSVINNVTLNRREMKS